MRLLGVDADAVSPNEFFFFPCVLNLCYLDFALLCPVLLYAGVFIRSLALAVLVVVRGVTWNHMENLPSLAIPCCRIECPDKTIDEGLAGVNDRQKWTFLSKFLVSLRCTW